jgi:glucan phosphorylase
MDRYVPLPPLPARISRLNELAYDLWWSWNADAREVFRDLDYPLWRFTDHNPVLLLHLVEPERLQHAAQDPEFLRLYDHAVAALDVVRVGAGTWWARHEAAGAPAVVCIAPGFSMHQALPLDCDGRAVAAGDFAKEASDLGIPLIGVGLMYPRGYLHQRLSADGWQQESYEYLDWSDAPISPALTADGTRCAFPVSVQGSEVHTQVWQVRAGRVTIYLIDADVPENTAADRELSAALSPAGSEMQLRQQALLDAAAPRALALLGIEPHATIDPRAEAPGVHVPSWIARDLAVIVERALGADWREHQDDAAWWDRVSVVADEELWDARQRLRGYLTDFMRERARRRWTREQATGPRFVAQGTLLDPGTLTIGVAGRVDADFRGEIVFHDVERLAAILTARRRPVQIVFAGRAHAGDEAGRRHLQQLFTRAIDPVFGGRIAFLEDYDLHAARLLVQGCDLWLSAPVAGALPSLGVLKAAINGVPHIAIEPSAQGAAGARALYRRLEEDIVPAFYHRDRRGVPAEWMARVRETLRTAIPGFCARRTVKAVAERLYNPTAPHADRV